METRPKYKVEGVGSVSPNSSIVAKRRLVLSNIYTQTVKELMIAMIGAGYAYDDFQQLCQTAMEATDALIEKTGEEL